MTSTTSDWFSDDEWITEDEDEDDEWVTEEEDGPETETASSTTMTTTTATTIAIQTTISKAISMKTKTSFIIMSPSSSATLASFETTEPPTSQTPAYLFGYLLGVLILAFIVALFLLISRWKRFKKQIKAAFVIRKYARDSVLDQFKGRKQNNTEIIAA